MCCECVSWTSPAADQQRLECTLPYVEAPCRQTAQIQPSGSPDVRPSSTWWLAQPHHGCIAPQHTILDHEGHQGHLHGGRMFCRISDLGPLIPHTLCSDAPQQVRLSCCTLCRTASCCSSGML